LAGRNPGFPFAAIRTILSGMVQTVTLRRAVPTDLSAVDRLLARSYPRLLSADYPPSVMVLAVPLFSKARPALLASGRYFVAEDTQRRILAAGGWSLSPVTRSGVPGVLPSLGQVRHVACDPDHLRQGLGRKILTQVLSDAAANGIRLLDCLSTRTAVPFYARLGFAPLGQVTITLGPAIEFPAVRMQRTLLPPA
jgi:GNAT superfamily N-acetyltransferase